MYLLYNFATYLTYGTLWLIALVHPKIRKFVRGRQETFETLKGIDTDRPLIWMHAASHGEYEQGLPVLQKIREQYPDYQILLSFFSPSGYEVMKDKAEADVVVYLPMDSASSAKRFIEEINPQIAIFIKYEIWPNVLRELERKQVPSILISAIFREQHIFFKSYGKFMRESLRKFSHLCVQDETSKKLLAEKGFEAVSVSGDTRFDRVTTIAEKTDPIDRISRFKGDHLCFVAGSSWPEDDKLLAHCINHGPEGIRYIIAPHKVKKKELQQLEKDIDREVCYWTSLEEGEAIPPSAEILFLDTVGLLSRVYHAADIAYVGGGFATGLHNTLEPAVFGIPVLIGPDFKQFREAREMVERKGILVVHEKEDLLDWVNRLSEDEDLRKRTGDINGSYVAENTGATETVMQIIHDFLGDPASS